MRIILFLVLVLFVAVLFAVGNERLNMRAKIITLFVGLAIFGVAFFYNESVNAKSQTINEIIENFIQNKSIKCGKYDINSTFFNYEYGTQSFVAKSTHPTLKGAIIPINQCLE